jgi:hypothetical protein
LHINLPIGGSVGGDVVDGDAVDGDRGLAASGSKLQLSVIVENTMLSMAAKPSPFAK